MLVEEVALVLPEVPLAPVVLLVVLDVPPVLAVLLDELLAVWIAETRLLKSVFRVSRLLSVEEVEEVPELLEPAVNSEISVSSLLEKVE